MRAAGRISLRGVHLVERVSPVGRSSRRRIVLSGASVDITADRYILTGEEKDRRCLVDLIVGRRDPALGSITRQGRCSYPVGRTSAFAIPVRGAEIVNFMGELYRFDASHALRELHDILPWPNILETRLDKAQGHQLLALSIAMARFIDVDILVIDGALAHPAFPERFLRYIGGLLSENVAGRLVLFSSRQFNVARAFANVSVNIANGKLFISKEIVGPLASSDVEEEPEGEPEVVYGEVDLI